MGTISHQFCSTKLKETRGKRRQQQQKTSKQNQSNKQTTTHNKTVESFHTTSDGTKTLSPTAAYLGLVGQLHPLTEAQRQLLTKYRADVSGAAVPSSQQPNSLTPHPTPGMSALPGSWAAPRRPCSERGAAGTLRRRTRGGAVQRGPEGSPFTLRAPHLPEPRGSAQRQQAASSQGSAGGGRSITGDQGRRRAAALWGRTDTGAAPAAATAPLCRASAPAKVTGNCAKGLRARQAEPS